MTEDNSAVRRLAFVNEWSDEFLAVASAFIREMSGDVRSVLEKAAADMSLSGLRDDGGHLRDRAARSLGFDDGEAMSRFMRDYPPLHEALNASPALKGGMGVVVGLSSTIVVFFDGSELLAFERARLEATDVSVGDRVKVGIFGYGEITARGNPGPYIAGEKYCCPVPEISYLPVSVIRRQEMDFRPEVMSVDDDVARTMDYSEPVDVTVFRYDSQCNDINPLVVLRDGHHRLAAALQTQRVYLPVNASAINAKGEKLNALILMSDEISARKQHEHKIDATVEAGI